MMNIGIPSIIVKMLRQKFDQQWSLRKTASTEDDPARILRLIKPTEMRMDARLEGHTLLVEDLMKLSEGDVLTFDYPVDKPIELPVNGKLKYHGQIVSSGRKRSFHIERLHHLTE